MAIFYNNQRYNMDWVPIDDAGNPIGEKDWAANRQYDAENDPSGAWNFSPDIKAKYPVAWDNTAMGQAQRNDTAPVPLDWSASMSAMDNALRKYSQQGPNPMPRNTPAQTSPYAWPMPAPTPLPSVGGWPVQEPSNRATTNPAVYTDMDQARQGLMNVYRQFLGRDPGEGDVDKWLTGQFGYGSGLQDYDKYVSAIMGSDEARQYRPQAPSGGYQGIEYWQSQGVPAADIFDPTTGQLRQGWERTAQGYQRTGGTTQTTTTTDPGGPRSTSPNDVQPWFLSLVNGLPPSPQSLKKLEPTLNKYGIKLGPLNARGFTDGIILPDGTFYDVIVGATENGGQSWAFMKPGAASPTAPPTQFDDPYTKYLEQLLTGRIGQLQQPVYDPNRAAYEAQLRQRAADLSRATPELNKLISYLETRFNDLQGQGYTGAENEAIRTGALDPIEQDRAAARKRVLERLSARGLTPDSGIAQQALLEVDKAFDAMRGTTQTALVTNDLNRRESRQQRAESIRSTLAQIPEGRARESLDVYSTLSQLSSLARAEDEARQREAIGYGGALADLGPQRLQLAMQAAGLGGNPSSMFTNLLQLAGLNQNAALYEMQNQNSLWSGLGSLSAILMNAGR